MKKCCNSGRSHFHEMCDELRKFIDYTLSNKDQRFWQALKNWSGAKAIWKQVEGDPSDIQDPRLRDTYED